MAVQTKIQHRRDTAANWTSTNPTLASGEIGFETDTLKFKVGNGSTAWTSLKYSQDASLLNGTASITALSTTGDVNASGYLRSFNSSGDEGGEIFLSKPVTNTNVNTGVTIDVYQDKLRFFEQGGSARGYYIDISLGGAGASTNLAGGGSAFNGGTITGSLTVSNTIGISTSGQYTSTLAQGTAPFVVSSNTIVTNLNADLLDGYHHATAATANTVVARDANGSFSANVITATLSGRATNANSIVGGGAGQLPYQNAANTTTFLSAATTTGSFLTYNTSTSAPEWDTPPQAMATLTGYTSTATAAGTTTLTNTSSYYQQFTGTSVQTVTLPVTSTLQTGWTFHIVNNSTGNVTVNSSGGNLVLVVPPGTTAMLTCIGTTLTTAADWEAGLTDFSTYTGTGSVVMNNTPTLTTPNIGAATGTSLNVTGGLFSTGDSNIGGTTTTNVRIMTRRIWISNTAPTGTNTTGDVWISW